MSDLDGVRAYGGHYVWGAGRWGTWLARRLHGLGLLEGTIGDRESAYRLAVELGVFHLDTPSVSSSDTVWLCMPDAEIANCAYRVLRGGGRTVAMIHASGSTPLLDGFPRSGVMWPIQSITHEAEPDWARLPFVVQASEAAFAKTLLDIAAQISGLAPKLVTTDGERQRLHLAATLTQNFGNLLWTLAEQVLAKADLDYRDLLPLAENHLRKLATTPPDLLQTGPAARGDEVTLHRHRAILADDLAAAEVYELLTRLIRERTRP